MPAPRVRSLVRSALSPPATGPDDRPDRELLSRFLSDRDEAAFAALVRRHGPVVRAVCRAALRNTADADDAFQATFLVLARRAAALRDPAALGGWLCAVAGRVARRLRAAAPPRAPLPHDLPDPAADEPAPDPGLREVLDQEVARLPEVYRLAVQACYVAGRTTEQAAALLGWPRGTVLTRLAWARKRLRSRLAARGVGLSIGAFGTLLGGPAASAVGRALVAGTARAAAAAAAGEQLTGVVSERTVTLSEGVIRAMVQNKLKWATGLVLVAALAGVGIGRWATADEPSPQPPRANRAAKTAPPTDTARPPEPTRPTAPPAPSDPPAPDRLPDRTSNPPAVRPSRVPPAEVPPAPVPPAAQQVAGGRQFVVSRPVGTWTREVAPEGGATVRVSVRFEEDRLTVRLSAVDNGQTVEEVLEADYSITRDSVVFGVITGHDAIAPAKGDYVDQPFAFRFRVDGGVLTLKDVRVPGVEKAGDALLGQWLAGRFACGADEPPAATPPGKPRGPSVAPRRAPPAGPPRSDAGFVPQPVVPGNVPGAPVGPPY